MPSLIPPLLHIRTTFTKESTDEQIIAAILSQRGFQTEEAIESFLHPPLPSQVSLLPLCGSAKAWKRTLALLKKIHSENRMIIVYADYDADGVTGGAIMWEGLHKLGFNVLPYIPDRKTEGYGFSIKGIDHLIREHDPALIISVDHGIVAHSQISYAQSKGVPVIVTDHHQKQGGDPDDAVAVFHTPVVSGAGVAYLFVQELYKEFDAKLPSDYAGLAAIGIVADMIELVGPARALVAHGLRELHNTPRLGLRYLLKEAGLDGKAIDTYHIGFALAPRINAFGRLDHALDALRLMCTTSYDKAVRLSAKAGTINTSRQMLVDKAVRQAMKQVDAEENIIILVSEEWEEGIIGLIAGKMLQAFYKPAIVLTRSDGHYKASVRSVEAIDIMAFLASFRDLCIDMGGHKAAAGLTLPADNLDTFVAGVSEKARADITEDMLVRTLHVDGELPIARVAIELAHALGVLQPFGMGNPQPTFILQGVVKSVQTLGKTGAHVKCLLKDGDDECEVLFFNADFVKDDVLSKQVKVVAEIGLNEWRGRVSVQCIGKHMYFDADAFDKGESARV